MPRLGPIRRRDVIRYLKQLGFEGPYSGGKHQFMVKGDITVRLPNPHQGDIGQEFLARILRQASIDREQWEAL
ncbi:MAG TPA: type II toxin-antitoxin system HicA family toxin [Candidatus Tectomicrobia bacterium]